MTREELVKKLTAAAEAACRILDDEDSYEGLKLAGTRESAERFRDDVLIMAHFIGDLVIAIDDLYAPKNAPKKETIQ